LPLPIPIQFPEQVLQALLRGLDRRWVLLSPTLHVPPECEPVPNTVPCLEDAGLEQLVDPAQPLHEPAELLTNGA
jgi:hypothetical protein